MKQSVRRWLFTGEQHDADSGLYYLRARYYDAATGRFLSQDPFGGVPSWPQTQEPYLHTASNPVNRIDPSGLYFVLARRPAIPPRRAVLVGQGRRSGDRPTCEQLSQLLSAR